MLEVIARVVHNGLRITRFLGRIANAPRTALIKPLDGLPIRLDVINTRCASEKRRVRNIYSSRNLIGLIVTRFLDTTRRRLHVWDVLREQPISASLLYVLTYRGGVQTITRTPDVESASRSTYLISGTESIAGVTGVRKRRVISAFADNHDVTRFIKKIETSSGFVRLGFSEVQHYLRLRGFKHPIRSITILFADMKKMHLDRCTGFHTKPGHTEPEPQPDVVVN